MKLIGLIDAAARYDKRTVTIREGEELEVPEEIGKSLMAQNLAKPAEPVKKPAAKRRAPRAKKADVNG